MSLTLICKRFFYLILIQTHVKRIRLGLELKTMIIAVPLLFAMFSNFDSDSLQVSAQLNNTNASKAYSATDGINSTMTDDKIINRGIVSSEEFKGVTSEPGDAPHGAVILKNNPNGSVYSGIITFTATKPVEIGISHRLHIDNSTYFQLDTKEFGEFYAGFHNGTGERGTPGVLSVPSVIIPDYGTAPPYFSASINFVGDSLWLRSPHGEPFIAVYEVVAEVVHPKGVVDVDSALLSQTNSTGSDQ